MLAYVQSFDRVNKGNGAATDVKCDPGGKAFVNAQHFAACGDDSPPLAGAQPPFADSPVTFASWGFMLDASDERSGR